MSTDTHVTPILYFYFLHTLPGYYLTPGLDISILHLPPIALAPMLSYPTKPTF